MTARERDPQGVSLPASDLTRIEALREACAKIADEHEYRHATRERPADEPCGNIIAAAIRALDLARLAPATHSGAATAEHSPDETAPREERTP